MKKLIAVMAIVFSTMTFAETMVVWVRGNSASQVEADMRNTVREINSSRNYRYNGQSCSNAKVYAASAPKKTFRVNRFGELQTRWTATIKVSCR